MRSKDKITNRRLTSLIIKILNSLNVNSPIINFIYEMKANIGINWVKSYKSNPLKK